MRCLSCKYDLSKLTEHRCPECGHAFDPNDPTLLAGQRFQWGTFLFRIAGSYVILTLLLAYLMADVWPWRQSDFLIFRNFAIAAFVPVTIVHALTPRSSSTGWLIVLLLGGMLALLTPPLAR